ncbi:hypothetical protein O163_04880 [Caldanaerobacter subterraneus subsp. yonseiensis KB-1]|uniref:Lipoprotein n=1 Tax=Caldanaerobacter subterraneus subsp. yonseiensis KB-1 TaxID=1388761 RepID=U5CU94_CALSX|nr:hypothetical protein [Caldanaerobacter subterraneus]ERM92501.1 hypothetical protein O163_04880 [Caldanaerobacter subterraneus subsp. yonseiensis KB-1]
MKKILISVLVLFLTFTLAAGCSDVKKGASRGENTVKETVQTKKVDTEKELIAGTVVSYQNNEIVLESSGEKVKYDFAAEKAVFVEGMPKDIKEGVFVKIIRKDGENYIYVITQGRKEALEDGSTSILGILKEANDKYVVLDINGKEERYTASGKTVMQKFSDSGKVMRYNKDELKKGNWVMVLVDKNNEVINVVY